jgi:hypothetical protein
LFDLAENLGRFVVRELDRGRQLDIEDAFLDGDERVELADNLVELLGPPLLDEEQDEVADELVGLGENARERIALDVRVDLRVLEHGAELGHFGDGLGEGVEVVADPLEAPLLLGRLEERVRVDALGDGN